MHKPVAGPFFGSVIAVESLTFWTARTLERLFGVFCIIVAVAVGRFAYLASSEPNLYSALVSAILALLVVAMFCLFAIHVAESACSAAVAWVYDVAFHRLAQTYDRAAPDLPGRGLFSGIAELIGDLALRRCKLGNALADEKQKTVILSRALGQGRERAQQVAGQIRQNAGSLAETAAEIDFNGEQVTREIASVGQVLAPWNREMDRAAAKLDALSESVYAIATIAKQMNAVAIDLVRLTHTAQTRIGHSSDGRALLSAFDRIGHALQMAACLGRSISVENAAAEIEDENVLAIAAELHTVASSCGPALDEASAFVRGLIIETSEANRRTVELDKLILTFAEITTSLQDAVEQQRIEVTQALEEVYQAREGFTTLKAGIDRMTRSAASRQDLAEELRSTARELPGQVESIASLLRTTTDFVTFRHS